MSITELLLRAVAGGVIVMAFALVGEVVTPKAFAGIFAAAPAVAVASLTVTLVTGGRGELADAGIGMVGGAVAMVAYCVVAARAVERFRAATGSVLSWVVWLGVALLGYAVVS